MKDCETATAPTELLVCTSCRAGQEIGPDGIRPGAKLHAALAAMDWPEGVVLRGGAGRWTYVYGRLDESLAGIVHDGTSRYHATDNGLVPWRERPEHFRKNCIARIPPLELPE